MDVICHLLMQFTLGRYLRWAIAGECNSTHYNLCPFERGYWSWLNISYGKEKKCSVVEKREKGWAQNINNPPPTEQKTIPPIVIKLFRLVLLVILIVLIRLGISAIVNHNVQNRMKYIEHQEEINSQTHQQ